MVTIIVQLKFHFLSVYSIKILALKSALLMSFGIKQNSIPGQYLGKFGSTATS